jgi:hypothetical protein
MPKLSKPAIGAALLGGAAGAHYLNKKRNEDPTRKPWDPKTDYQMHYDYVVLGGSIPVSLLVGECKSYCVCVMFF